MQQMDMDEDRSRTLLVPQGGLKDWGLPYRCLTIGLLLLCALSLAGNVAQFYFGGGEAQRLHHTLANQEEQLQERYRNLTRNSTGLRDGYHTLQLSNDALTQERDQLQGQFSTLTSERDQLQGQASSITLERDQLQGQASTLTLERDQLQGRFSTLTKEKDQLEGRFSTLTKERDQLQGQFSTLTKEKDQLQGRFSTLTKEKDQLQGRFSTLTKERDQLQASTNVLRKEHLQLQSAFSQLSASESQLKKEVKRLNDTVNKSRECPPEWFKFQFSCYIAFYGKDQKNWEDSRLYCKSQQADLVIINSLEEQIFINSSLPNVLHNWIGLSDIRTEGVWIWVDETTPTTTYWEEDQPTGGSQNCGTTWTKGGWNDFGCEQLGGWICEK